jgi:hypothetical protein
VVCIKGEVVKLTTIDDLMVHLFDIKLDKSVYGELIVVIKEGRVFHVHKKQVYKNKGDVRKR